VLFVWEETGVPRENPRDRSGDTCPSHIQHWASKADRTGV